ncbi:(2Fe-2S)-binding protein [Streptomyces sp. PT12]|uniref:(2Fe-2S)-binding protein n=1 Tax=Streptomyces sp. PT12 TaxID=1510197 RepID=UPI000DE4F9C7|nr:(2Fe-2S)-binding protein [Streptomyces sp. PT12]RBM14373.1 hypothetical protein DEH69_18560 [Streptomyces sp. PT12]
MTAEPPTLTLTFEGRPLTARPGQSVAAALTDAGVRAWRTTRGEGAPRGLFCGIGVCYDCLITVDGRPAQRACLVPAAEGMALTSAPPPLPRPSGADGGNAS